MTLSNKSVYCFDILPRCFCFLTILSNDFREKLRKAVKAHDTYGLVMDRVKLNAQKPQHQALTNGAAENQPLAITGL